jgi:hypothetical protein
VRLTAITSQAWFLGASGLLEPAKCYLAAPLLKDWEELDPDRLSAEKYVLSLSLSSVSY